ncbi:MAG: metal-sensing transcriptional repressor [Candidatus Atribacteria bacterium]|nr:metal-sensing transcriptional repressor [Candidatus Atribacteria bacterium]MCD6349441.1 metal-sensing transcriptional repressor [Candidatus Atribacteria bacterium]
MAKHTQSLRLLSTARGQLEAVIRMVEENAYCIDISRQILATIALLKRANSAILKKHIETCVKNALQQGKFEDKLKELEEIFRYMERIV